MDALIDGIKVPRELLGDLKETNLNTSNDILLRNNLEQDGYLFLKNVIEPEKIIKARNDIFKQLNEVKELKDPFADGIASGKSIRDQIHKDRGVYWENLSSTESLRDITNGNVLENVFKRIFGSSAKGFDFIFLKTFSKTFPLVISLSDSVELRFSQ